MLALVPNPREPDGLRPASAAGSASTDCRGREGRREKLWERLRDRLAAVAMASAIRCSWLMSCTRARHRVHLTWMLGHAVSNRNSSMPMPASVNSTHKHSCHRGWCAASYLGATYRLHIMSAADGEITLLTELVRLSGADLGGSVSVPAGGTVAQAGQHCLCQCPLHDKRG